MGGKHTRKIKQYYFVNNFNVTIKYLAGLLVNYNDAIVSQHKKKQVILPATSSKIFSQSIYVNVEKILYFLKISPSFLKILEEQKVYIY